MKKVPVIISMVLVFMVCSLTISAQTTIVKGILADSLTKECEPYATIRVYKAKDKTKVLGMSVTDINGKFSQSVKGKGSYVISFGSMGKKTVNRIVQAGVQDVINMDTVYTSDDAKVLKGVEVVAQKPLVKMETDKLSYRVEDDVDSKSSTVLEMLRKVPMVTVDGQDNITVNGSSYITVVGIRHFARSVNNTSHD